MKKLDLFRNLVVLAASDRRLTEEEVAFLATRAEAWDITQEEFEETLSFAVSPQAELQLPSEPDEQRELLREMIHLMAVDGHLADIEKDLCAAAAVAMGCSIDEFNRIVDSLV